MAFWRDPLGFFAQLAGEQGDIARTRLGWRRVYLLNHPQLVNELMVTHPASFAKGYSLTRTRLLLGDGLLTSDGELHRRQRRRLKPAFERQRLAAYGDTMVRCSVEAAARWHDGEELDVVKAMMLLSQRIVVESLFGADLGDDDGERASAALDAVVRHFHLLMLPLTGYWLLLPFPSTRRLFRARATLDRLIRGIVRAGAREHGRGHRGEDVISLLLSHNGDRANTERQVRDEAMTLFLAGHDTLGNALLWTWYLLSQNPEAEGLWHAELDEVLAGRPPTAADLAALPYTRRLLLESMRLYPPVWSVGRQARHDVELGGCLIPAGSVVQVSQWLLHRDERFFPQPLRFLPERWTPGFEQQAVRGAYFPFGLGPRVCIGMQFALNAGILALATLGRHWRLCRDAGDPVATHPRITLRPAGDLRMRLERRGPGLESVSRQLTVPAD